MPTSAVTLDDDAADTCGRERTGTSDVARLAAKDFAAFTDEELAVARLAMQRLRWSPGERRTRRWSSGRGPRVDLRAAIGRSLRTGGDVATLPTRRRRTRPRQLVLLCDVSGSMERHSRVLLHFAHAMGLRHRLEAFLFSTQLTRITRELRTGGLDDVLAAVARTVPDFSGGTRIGASLRTLHQQWGRRVLGSRVVVLVISDGWDRGDPQLLREQVARLQRSCHLLLWLTPLLGTPGYTPSTRGLEAALPFVDAFLPARTLTDIADLAVHLNALEPFRRPGPGGYIAAPRDSKGRR